MKVAILAGTPGSCLAEDRELKPKDDGGYFAREEISEQAMGKWQGAMEDLV